MPATFRKTIFLSFFFTYLSLGCIYPQSSTMFLYETENGYTYVDKDFRPLMNKTFTWAGRFFEGLAAASENGYAGYINPKGNFVIKPEFEYALPFHNGVAKVWKDGKPYIINKKGKILFEHNYLFIKYAIKDSYEAIFIVTTQRGKCGVIDKKGKLLVDTIYNRIQPYSEGLAIVSNDGEQGVINLEGKIIVPFGRYSRIGDYNSARAAVISDEWDGKTIGFIDDKGNLVFTRENCNFDHYNPSAFSDNLVVLNNSENHDYILIDTQGNEIYDSKHYINVLKYGYASVRDTLTYKYNIIDKSGKEVYRGADNVLKINDEIFFVDGTTIKTESGPEVKKESVFIKNSDYYSSDIFIHGNLILTGKRQGKYMIWSPESSFYDPGNTNDFTFIDPDGFKNGLLYVVFYDNRYSDLSWGYINEHGDIVYRNRNKEYFDNGVKLNINYAECRGFFNCIDENDNDLKQSVYPGKITLSLDSAVYEKTLNRWDFPPKRMCHSFRIINETPDTLLIRGYISDRIFVQAKDKNGVWRNIQTHIPSDLISDEIHGLAPGKFWEFAIQSYSGGFKTKMRVIVEIPAEYTYDWENFSAGPQILSERKEFISNEIDCEINASQFVRGQFPKSASEAYPFEDYVFDRIVSIP